MLAERIVLVSILTLTKEGSAKIKDVAQVAGVPVQIVRQVLQKNAYLGMFHSKGERVAAGPEQRLKAAIGAIQLGADIEGVCRHLKWGEFEDVSIFALEDSGFTVKKHFRFNWSSRRWEIDLLASREPFVMCIDCKQWHRGWRSASSKAAERQIERTKALAEASGHMDERIGIKGWKRVCLVPVILSLMPGASKFHEGAPIVPILQLRDFLQQMPAHIEEITHFWT